MTVAQKKRVIYESGKKWQDSGSLLQVEPIEFAQRLDKDVREIEDSDDSEVIDLKGWKMGFPVPEREKAVGRAVLERTYWV